MLLSRKRILQITNMSKESNLLPTDPISAVGVITSFTKAPEGYYVVAQTTDGSDADLWKDGLFKSKVTRYLCFSRKTGPEVVVDMKLIDIKDALPEFFTPVQGTLDTKETAFRKKRLCVKMSRRETADTAVCDIQVTLKSKFHLVNHTSVGDINNMGIWYRMGDLPRHHLSQETPNGPQADALLSNSRRTIGRPYHEQQHSGIYTMTDAASQFNGHYDQIPGRDRGGISLQLRNRAKHCSVTSHLIHRSPLPDNCNSPDGQKINHLWTKFNCEMHRHLGKQCCGACCGILYRRSILTSLIDSI
ncbi:multivesicular body subunit 12Bb isoform X2 [Leuresthes tenuis]|uniref:multivesicular body subunit 12Bb isoform X2 n=1 Tax=Leuresthes tenuis TaxID=355514 RepID=UPI003B512053